MEKTCSKCGLTKNLEDFHLSPTGTFGRHGYCKACRNPQARAKQAIYDRNPHGLVIPSCCEICGSINSKRRNHRDHDHSTNKKRGSLCLNCNIGLGHFRDNILLLKKAILYLEKYI